MIKKSLGLKVLILPLSLAVVAFISIFLIQPEYKKMLENKRAFEQNGAKLNDMRIKVAKLYELKKNFESTEDAKMVNAALPESEATENYLDELQQRAIRSGIAMSTVDTSGKAEGSSVSVCPVGQVAANSSESTGGFVSAPASEIPSSTASPESANAAVQAPCAKNLDYNIVVKGSWDQLLNFFKYLSDSNRVANIKKVDLMSTEGRNSEGQQPSDLISANILLEVYMKPKSQSSEIGVLNALDSGTGFNNETIKKVKDIIYSQYEPPIVTETTERNFFK